MNQPADDFFAGGGEMGARMRAFDWTQTPLGPPANWPEMLKAAVRLILASRQPFWIGWGQELTCLYNDAYKTATMGDKHPWALGRPIREIWREIWRDIGPRLEAVMDRGEAAYVEAQRFITERNGYPEETYFTFSFSPIVDEHGRAQGVICASTDDTRHVIGERQLALLHELAARAADSRTVAEAWARCAEAFSTNRRDLPFVLLYRLDSARELSLASTSGIGVEAVQPLLSSSWPLQDVIAQQKMVVVPDLGTVFGATLPPCGDWDRPPQQAVLLPVTGAGAQTCAGVLVAGLNPFRRLDDPYRSFLTLAAGQVSAGLAAADVLEREKRRAQALGDLDRAKTAFVSNVSDEFRTPLMLMLGPLEDVLQDPGARAEDKLRLAIAHRGSLRLLQLVNSLLDFSRIEAGSVPARFEAVDLPQLTGRIASAFRSVLERAGLSFHVDVGGEFRAPAYVDREMWEKVVLNLLSNALKYTLEGEIRLSLKERAGQAELSVRDTGVGIPPGELEKIFQRFHRIEGQHGRTREGAGIGLALVRELVKLHGGEVRAESTLGAGSTFTVSIPLGAGHLAPERVRQSASSAPVTSHVDAFVKEALQWLPESPEPGPAGDGEDVSAGVSSPLADTRGARVLLADDNADMRATVRRWLAPQWDVETAADGQAALEAARRRVPELILSNVRMPRLDGFGLLKAAREDVMLRGVPFILLSARAGEEARAEGLAAGADDYLAEPFSARELVARVGAQLQMTHLRREANRVQLALSNDLRRTMEMAATGLTRCSRDLRFVTANPAYAEIAGLPLSEIIGRPLVEVLGVNGLREILPRVERVLQGERVEFDTEIAYTSGGHRSLHVVYAPDEDESGEIVGWVASVVDISALRRSEQQLTMQRERLLGLAQCALALTAAPDLPTQLQIVTDQARVIVGAHQGLSSLTSPAHDGKARDWSQTITALSLSDKYAAYRGYKVPTDGSGIYRLVCESNRPMRMTAAELDAHPAYRRFGAEASRHPPLPGWLAAPLIGSNGDNIGLIQLGDKYEGEFDAEDEAILVQLAQLASAMVERSRSEEAVRWSETRFRALTTTSTHRVFRMSPGWTDIVDLDPQALTSETAPIAPHWLTEFALPDDQPRLQQAIQQAIEAKSLFETEHRFRRPDGSLGWALSRVVPLLDDRGEIREWFGTVSDVTDRKRSELALAQETKVLERIASGTPLHEILEQIARSCDEQSPEGICCAILLLDEERERLVHGAAPGLPSAFNLAMDGTRIGPRAGSCGTAAYQESTVCVANIANDPRWTDYREIAARFHLAACCAQPIFSSRDHGRSRVLGTVALYNRQPEGLDSYGRELMERAAHLAAIAIERTRAEEELRRALDAEQRAHAAAEAAGRLKDEFLATLSHELRTPLNAILGWTQLLQHQPESNLDLTRGLQVIERNAQAQAQLVGDLLDMSRIVSGKMQMTVTSVDLGQVVHHAMETTRPAFQAKRVRLESDLDPDTGAVLGDEARLQQVVWNLLSNAIKFTPVDGRVRIALHQRGRSMRLTVSDTGIGIAPQFLPHIFERFRQADASTTRQHGGLGLGLAIARSLVELHGGTLYAESAGEGQGAAFTVELPVSTGPAMGESGMISGAEAWISGQELEGIRVLVVEDEADARDVLRRALEGCKATVLLAANAAEALSLLERERPQVMVSDIGLPDLDGYHLLQRVRELPSERGGGLPAIALTAYARPDDRRRAFEAGYRLHLAKPVELSRLIDAVAGLSGRAMVK